ncbi:DeoR/GlpR family DNA-binding transcription regulator [Ruminococcus sp. Marseille-P6503]|uniref:DeoR/GlpR family DNA-binding transcription regulator n=1 Tax=Ruminococcus sp. Marseille-P6503 TaxID=2364796 RepID=UPI000F523406|nr:DeoR/GlpR family DNA-binding transcription regulator [Ruminococcus sp. Marseille-P6503]
MLTEERHSIILDTVNRQHVVKLTDLCEMLDSSESTVRRDLNQLARRGLLTKVHGGAIALNESFSAYEHNVEEKASLFIEEKTAIARYAASLIEEGDFVYIDAGTTTEKMIDYIPSKNVTFVTNAFINAKKLAQKGCRVFIPAGEIKLTTEAIVGAECVISLQNYNFSKCFMGTNGISASAGLSTPDKSEASVKTAVISRSKEVYFLADHSKFDKVAAVTFSSLNRGMIITDRLPDKKYLTQASIKEVL